MTDVEQMLWRLLRNRQIAGLKFRRQATIERYIVDFLCVEASLAIEFDGGQHSIEPDATRTAAIETADYQVLRFWNNEVIESLDGVVEAIVAAAQRRRGPSPNPLP